MSKIQLTDENRKIKEKLIWDFSNTRLSTDINRDIVKLIAEMTAEALQLSQENKREEEN